MPELSTIYDYMRSHAVILGDRILQEYPALHQFDDPVSPRLRELLRSPFPAQTIAIMGLAKRWEHARTAMVVAECGTGKTLISLEGFMFTATENLSRPWPWFRRIWWRSGHAKHSSLCRGFEFL